jgi:hypothetical protein
MNDQILKGGGIFKMILGLVFALVIALLVSGMILGLFYVGIEGWQWISKTNEAPQAEEEVESSVKDPKYDGAPEPATVEQVAKLLHPDHWYSMRDGYEYGYEMALSQDAQNQGQATAPLVMVKYAGSKGNVHQAYIRKGYSVTVFECADPCEFIKIMGYAGGPVIQTEHIRNAPGIIAWEVMQDAIGGKLERYIADKKGKRYYVWFEPSGPKLEPVAGTKK